ncbi:uncharacterized protein CCHa2 isoform X1 [Eurosta solidaginis]|uniref:uncharacterized protein CCHa2 isoform X1 n=1 Tax=Eurosta solidaginis TaxID=178769 RepID=UPI0035311FDF
MQADNIGFAFERLKGRENFDVWKLHAKSYLVIKGCWDVVQSGLKDDAAQKDVQADGRALAEITLMVEPINFSHIATAKTAKEAWEALISAYEDSGLTRRVGLLKQLVQCRLSDFSSMQEYLNSLVMTSLKVQNAGLKIDEEVTGSLILAGLPDDFRALVLAIENSNQKLTIDSVKTLLLQEAKFDRQESENALYIKNKKKTTKFLRCHNCKEEGHFARKCPNKRKSGNTHTKGEKILFASLLSHDSRTADWHTDSGATAHMTQNKNIIFNEKQSIDKNIIVANNKTIPVVSSGNVKLCLSSGYDAVLKVDYVPELCANLLSVREMTKNCNKRAATLTDTRVMVGMENVLWAL